MCPGVQGSHGQIRLSIPFPYVDSRSPRFVHGGLKRGLREHSVNRGLYINGSGSITFVGEERAKLSAVILFLSVLGMGYVILLWHSRSLPYNYFDYTEDIGEPHYKPVMCEPQIYQSR